MHIDARGYGYETYRDGGRVCRRYVGKGVMADAVMFLDRHDRQRAQEERDRQRQQIEAIKAPDAAIKAYCRALDALVSDAMTAAGYHCHKRGEWRKRRAQRENTMPLNIMLPAKAIEGDKNHAKLKAAQTDEGKARAWLDNFAGGNDEAQIYALLAPVQKTAAEGLIVSLCGDNELAKEAQRRQLERTAQEIAGPNPTPLETQLAARVALCELSVARMESIYANTMAGGGKSLKAISLFGRELDAAHRRHLSACKALAMVRKAQLPNVQVNIGEKQVNIGTLETR